MLGSVVLLIKTLQQTFAQMTTDNPRIGGQQALQPSLISSEPEKSHFVLWSVFLLQVPGVNLPTSQLAYFFIALLLSGVIHELGHAVAALREQVRVNGFGMFVFVVYPGAFVDLFTTHLNLISPAQQLRIFCAGVWHNFVLCVAALAFLFLLPVFLFPMYSTGGGALITEVVQGSAADGPRGLSVGDIVTGLEDCPVRGVEDWTSCLSHLSHTPQTGYCVPVASLQPSWAHGRAFKRLDGTMDCCSNSSLTDLCFSYVKPQSRHSREREVTHQQTHWESCRIPVSVSVHVLPDLTSWRLYQKKAESYLYPVLSFPVSLTNFVPRFGFLHLDLPVFLETFFSSLKSVVTSSISVTLC
uniref:Membrane-bound transcription factor site-2 protease n=1 Tax=Acanthochromis polyacanthus TaxID=80966 RepID=A0A3Q1EVV9_9TELE